MNVSDSDLAMLELMLDGELPEEAAETLRASMQHDAGLAAAWATLQSERAIRLAMWHDNQPTQQRVNIVASRVLRQNRFGGSFLRWGFAAKLGSAVAACVVLGFGLGWYGRGTQPVTVAPAESAMQGTSAEYRVELTDSSGQAVAAQQFPSFQQAVDFANDVNQWKSVQNRRAGSMGDAMVVPVSDPHEQ